MHVETKVDTNSAISDDAPNFDDKSDMSHKRLNLKM